MTHDIEHLLKPRYEVIADYPNSPFTKGEILKIDSTSVHDLPVHKEYCYEGVNYWYESDFMHYPHLFRKLAWYEKRDISEMPMYVFLYNQPRKVIAWRLGGAYKHVEVYGFGSAGLPLLTPATEKDYTDCVNSINQK